MSENNVGNECSSLDPKDYLARHRKEKKDLQAEIQKLKHSVPKGDKKKKKEMTEKVEKLESELEARHESELQQLNGITLSTVVTENDKDLSKRLKNIDIIDNHVDGDATIDSLVPDFKFMENENKSTKNKRRKEKKDQKNQEQEERIRNQEAENKKGNRAVEAAKIKRLLEARHLSIHEIPSDGNCLYSAIRDQLERQDIRTNVESLRRQTATYMRTHPDDFLPFLVKDGSGDLYSLEEFDSYCQRIEMTSEWGGHVEIRAMSDVLEAPIEVVQADGPSILIGEQFSERKPLILSYHRYAYGLGEHYNSVIAQNDSNKLDAVS